jgi:hypothetical protein
MQTGEIGSVRIWTVSGVRPSSLNDIGHEQIETNMGYIALV